MKRKLYYIATLLTLLCCSEHPGQVRIRGKFAHLEQGEFFIYSPDGGLDRMDSLHIRDGRFAYDFPLEGRATMQILYPNQSRLAVFARSGDDIRVEGDAQNLNGVKVSGTEDNELYTLFRQESQGRSAEEVRKLANDYILAHPTLAMSQYLFREYFLLADSLDASQVREVFDSLCRANPDDVLLSRMARTVHAYGLISPGKTLPSFSLTIRPEKKEMQKKTRQKPQKEDQKDSLEVGRTIKSEDYKDGHLLIVFWAGWKSGSQSGLFRARTFRRKIKKEYKLNLLSYSLDVEEEPLKRAEERDSVNYPSFCDYQSWRSPLVEQWGIRELPYFVLVGPDLHIIACGSDWARDIEPKAQLLCL